MAIVCWAACGGNDDDTTSGTIGVRGAPHTGAYATCNVGAVVGDGVTITCSRLPDCATCTLILSVPTQPGTYDCDNGQVAVLLSDTTFDNTAGAGCGGSPHINPTGDAKPGCPSDADGCNQVLGACSVSVEAITAGDGSARGHFSGSITATAFTHAQTEACGNATAVVNAGDVVNFTASGTW